MDREKTCLNDIDSICEVPRGSAPGDFVTVEQVSGMCSKVNDKLNALSSSVDASMVEAAKARLKGDRVVLRAVAEHEVSAKEMAREVERNSKLAEELDDRMSKLESHMEFSIRWVWVLAALSITTAVASLFHVLNVTFF